MKKIYEHSDDVHVKSCIAYGKAEDKKLYCELEYKTLAAQEDLEDAFLKRLLLIDDGTNKLAPVAMTEDGFVTVNDGTTTGTAATTVWTVGA